MSETGTDQPNLPRRRRKASQPVAAGPPIPAVLQAGPADVADAAMRQEAKRALVWVGVVGAAALAVWLAEPLLVIFAGMVLAATIDGGARLLDRVLPIGRGWRVMIVLLVAVAFFVWTVQFAGSQIADQAAALPGIIENQVNRGFDWLRAHGVRLNFSDFKGLAQEAAGGVVQVTNALGGLLGVLTTLFLVLVLGIYFAAEPKLYRRGVAWMLPMHEREQFHVTTTEMGRALRRLMAGRLLGMALEGVVTWLALAIYGVPMAALLGLLTGLLAFLPNIGAPVSGAIMVLVGFSGGTEMGIYCIIVYVALHTIDGNLIAPFIARKTVDLPPALVLSAQLILGTLFGIIGLALADPLVAMIKIALERHSQRVKPEPA